MRKLGKDLNLGFNSKNGDLNNSAGNTWSAFESSAISVSHLSWGVLWAGTTCDHLCITLYIFTVSYTVKKKKKKIFNSLFSKKQLFFPHLSLTLEHMPNWCLDLHGDLFLHSFPKKRLLALGCFLPMLS